MFGTKNKISLMMVNELEYQIKVKNLNEVFRKCGKDGKVPVVYLKTMLN